MRVNDLTNEFCHLCCIFQDFPQGRGETKEKFIKYLQGGGMLLGIVFIIWFPLILISVSNSTTLKNTPSEATISLQLGRYEVAILYPFY